MELPHRAADATLLGCPDLVNLASEAFAALKAGDAAPLAAFAPTSLIFGVWDSRGGSGQKRPRLLRSIIRAHGVEILHAAAQYTSAIRHASDDAKKAFADAIGVKPDDLSEDGFADAVATFRKVSRSAGEAMSEFTHGLPNPNRRVLGGIMARGSIIRDVTINLIALRALRTRDEIGTRVLREYILSLTLVAATIEADDMFFLREGCLLRSSLEREQDWRIVHRRGEDAWTSLAIARDALIAGARKGQEQYKKLWPNTEKPYVFGERVAKAEISKRSKRRNRDSAAVDKPS
jgi:CRISPR-associated protein Csb1